MTTFFKNSLFGIANGPATKAIAAWNRWRQRQPKSRKYFSQSAAACIAACTAFATGACIVWLLPYQAATTDLRHLRQQELALKQAYLRQLAHAPQIGPMQARKRRTEQTLALLQQQLTGSGEQDAVMNEIDTAGRARGLRFTMFKPEMTQKTTIRLSAIGSYEAITRFVGDLAQLPRIVVLDPLTLQAAGDSNSNNASAGLLNLQATAIAVQSEPRHDDRNEPED